MAYNNTNGTAKKNTTRNVTSKSFKSNVLFQISLVEEMEPKTGYEEKYFLFYSMMPKGTVDGVEKYVKSGAINMKVTLDKSLAFAYAVKYASIRNKLGTFSIFTDSTKSDHTDSTGIKKQCSVNNYSNKRTINGKEEEIPQVAITMTASGAQKLSHPMHPEEGLAVSRIIEMITEEGLKLEIESKKNQKPTIASGKLDAPQYSTEAVSEAFTNLASGFSAPVPFEV